MYQRTRRRSSSQESVKSQRHVVDAPESPVASSQHSDYIQHRSMGKRLHIESTTSEFEHDEEIQQRQRLRLEEIRMQKLQTHYGSSSRLGRCGAGFPTILISVVIFFVVVGAGVAVGLVIGHSEQSAMEEEARASAEETGQFFSEQLDRAILPLFSIAQFAVHLGIFRDLPKVIGPAGAPGSLPLNRETWKRNVTGVCNDPTLVSTFADIASSIKNQSGMDGILADLQLSPQGVVCLLYPINNTEDFGPGQFLDNAPVLGLDLFHDPSMKAIALKTIKQQTVGIAGPIQLIQCPSCGPFLIARLPIVDKNYQIYLDGVPYDRWGFATALIKWTALVEHSGIYESFSQNPFEFQLSRTDLKLNTQTLKYDSTKVVLAETSGFPKSNNWRYVSTSLQTADNEWVMTVAYDPKPIVRTMGLVIGCCVVVAFFIAILVYKVLSQKHVHTSMLAESSAQEARVATERDMTAYFAHELRNPLSALDSALSSITTEDLPTSTKELLDGMQLCSSFMSSIMNNLLDLRKLEEGKMRIRSRPLSLRKLVDDSQKMMKSSVRAGVEFLVVKDIPQGHNWVLGDEPRIQQVLTNVVTNAIKYTLQGSITLAVSWKGNFVQLECIDTGPGIPKSEQERMFERFVQRGGAPGTGLGLNIAQQIVHMMQGSICFESDPTVKPGTTCRILLPMMLCEQPHEPAALPAPDVAMIDQPLNILIVDDIKMNRTMLMRRIQKAIAPKAKISTAQTAEEALEICNSREFDIIICDQYMEEAGGVMVGTDAIIAMRRNKVNAFIVGCSGNDLDAEFYNAGADMVWGKPVPTNAEIIGQWRNGLFAKDIQQRSTRAL